MVGDHASRSLADRACTVQQEMGRRGQRRTVAFELGFLGLALDAVHDAFAGGRLGTGARTEREDGAVLSDTDWTGLSLRVQLLGVDRDGADCRGVLGFLLGFLAECSTELLFLLEILDL